MRNVKMAASLLEQSNVAFDHQRLRVWRHSVKTKTERSRSSVDGATATHRRNLRMLDHRHIEFFCRDQRSLHHLVVGDRLAVVAERDGTRGTEGAKVRDFLTQAADR